MNSQTQSELFYPKLFKILLRVPFLYLEELWRSYLLFIWSYPSFTDSHVFLCYRSHPGPRLSALSLSLSLHPLISRLRIRLCFLCVCVALAPGVFMSQHAWVLLYICDHVAA